ncbi:hypothetical protein, partial [Bauldia litoralis]|uniref:hypothetical protein n=2 Tax=Alphaproteobacteria TaxID=28211 RepID=UPI003267B2E6
VLHRDGQRPAAEIPAYLKTVHAMIAERAAADPSAYFGVDLAPPPRQLPAAERQADFDAELAVDACQTAEVAIDPMVVAEALRRCIADHTLIETRFGVEVIDVVEEADCVRVTGQDGDGPVSERFDHAVNTLWCGRLALNEPVGLETGRAWVHRLKYGVSFRFPEGADRPRSATFILGPFGEVVSYGEGLTYLTLYPACLRAILARPDPAALGGFSVGPDTVGGPVGHADGDAGDRAGAPRPRPKNIAGGGRQGRHHRRLGRDGHL